MRYAIFDAGAIVAHLDIDQGMFDRKMDAVEQRVRKFEDEGHKVKISAVFDNASMGRARQLFTQLDQQLSRDAMSRLRSSPQGSVLGALNALFSPHPVTGAPSASQAASQGLLGRIASQPVTSAPGGTLSRGSGSTTAAGGASGVIRQVLSGQGASNVNTTDTIRQNLVGQKPGDVTTTDTIQRRITGAAPGNITTTDTIKEKLDKGSADQVVRDSGTVGDRSGRSFAASFAVHLKNLFSGMGGGPGGQGSGGGGAAGFGKNLAGGIGPGILGINPATKAGAIAGLGSIGLAGLGPLLAGAGTLGVAGAGVGALGAAFKGVQSQVSPVSQALTQGQQALSMATTPAAVKAAQAQIAGANQAAKQLSPALQSILKSEQTISKTWQEFTTGLAPVFAKALSSVAQLLTSLLPTLKTFFSSASTLIQPLIGGLGDLAKTALPLLGQAFRVVAPFLRPILDGLGKLVGGLLTGLITLLKAAGPGIAVLAQALGTLGKDLGGFLSAFAPVMAQSAVIFKALFDVVGALLPIIGQLAAILARALAPVFVVLAGVIESLLPFLTVIGKLFAALAAAMLGDLVAAFTALANLLKAVAPALTVFANVLATAFSVLENSGVFAIIGDALEKLVGPLATLINALLKGLTPILPVVIKFISQLSTILINGLVSAVLALLPPLTQLATNVLGVIAKILPVVLPLLVSLAGIFTAAVVAAISGVATALSSIINAIPPSALTVIVVGIVALVAAFKTMAVIRGILDGLQLAVIGFGDKSVVSAAKTVIAWVAAAAPVVGSFVAMAASATAAYIAENLATLGIIAGITLLVAGIVYLATHWSQVWGEIKRLAADAWNFIYNGIGKYLLPLLGPVGLIALGAIELAKHWQQVTTDIKNWAADLWNWFSHVFGTDIANFFTKTIPGWWDAAVGFLKTKFIGPLENDLRAAWNWVVANVGTPIHNFFTGTLPGYWNTAIGFLRTNFITPFQNGLKGAWNWVVTNVFDPLANLVTKTLPGWFNTAVAAIGKFWGGIEGIVKAPVKFVINDILDGLINVFDAITGAIGLKSLHINPVYPLGKAAGGRITDGTGPTADDVLIRVSRDETVVSAAHSRQLAPLFAMMGVPGYAAGGKTPSRSTGLGSGGQAPSGPSPLSRLIGGAIDVGKIIADAATGNVVATTNAVESLIGKGTGGASGGLASLLTAIPQKAIGGVVNWVIGQLAGGTGAGSGSQIVAYAQSFLGKIPYVWGGQSLGPAGADCSGFTGAIYRHFGYAPPRTSEAQGAWVTKGSPQPGDLAFYHSPPGGPDPGHVAIVRNAASAISQGGGLGPQIMALHALPLLWTGSPPGGFKTAGAAGPGGGSPSANAALAKTLMPAWNSGALWQAWNALEMQEAGWNQFARNPSSGAYGIPQALPPSKMGAAANPPQSNVAAQIRWMVSYIQSMYGNPIVAQAHENAFHWYGNGGQINEPIIGFGQVTGAKYGFGERGDEYVTPGGGDKLDRIASLLSQLIDTTASVPHGIGGQLGMALSGAASSASFRNRYPRGGA